MPVVVGTAACVGIGWGASSEAGPGAPAGAMLHVPCIRRSPALSPGRHAARPWATAEVSGRSGKFLIIHWAAAAWPLSALLKRGVAVPALAPLHACPEEGSRCKHHLVPSWRQPRSTSLLSMHGAPRATVSQSPPPALGTYYAALKDRCPVLPTRPLKWHNYSSEWQDTEVPCRAGRRSNGNRVAARDFRPQTVC